MSQLTANRNDPGKGRNMPVHYSGKSKVGVVSVPRNPIEIDYRATDGNRIVSMPLPQLSGHRFRMPLGLHML